jgi:glycosyltransferase involved in cell wall biosynthesis
VTLSVAMCTYNGARFLPEQLRSIAAQTRAPDELVVCDDQSSDDTPRLVESFAASAPFPVRLVRNEERLGSTRNFGRAVSLCRGSLIALSDQDDSWHPEKLERLESALESSGAGLAFCDGEAVDEELRPLGAGVWESIRFGPREREKFRRGEAFDVLLDHNVVTGAAALFRAEFRDLVLPIPLGLMHDGWPVIHDGWTALLVSAVADIAAVPERLYSYRQHAGQQLGLRGAFEGAKPAAGVLEAARRGNDFGDELRYLSALYERLSANAGPGRGGRAVKELRARLAHVGARAGMPAPRLGRVPRVLGELLSLRYHRFSNGFASAAKDLWLRRGA